MLIRVQTMVRSGGRACDYHAGVDRRGQREVWCDISLDHSIGAAARGVLKGQKPLENLPRSDRALGRAARRGEIEGIDVHMDPAAMEQALRLERAFASLENPS